MPDPWALGNPGARFRKTLFQEVAMKRIVGIALGAAFLLPPVASANDELLSLQNDDKQWVMARKNYSATGYSTLNQITTANVKGLKQMWSFSTGALRGHEG